jgi:hypothetical protein
MIKLFSGAARTASDCLHCAVLTLAGLRGHTRCVDSLRAAAVKDKAKKADDANGALKPSKLTACELRLQKGAMSCQP